MFAKCFRYWKSRHYNEKNNKSLHEGKSTPHKISKAPFIKKIQNSLTFKEKFNQKTHFTFDLENLYTNMTSASFLALFFCLFGTVLGGIWADQSWGRFWGWDPKENGALAIVIWLLVLIHGRLAGILQDRGYAAGMIITNAVVALSWFGVNLPQCRLALLRLYQWGVMGFNLFLWRRTVHCSHNLCLFENISIP